VHPLSQPGTADLSAWVDFSALRQAAQESGAGVEVHGPISQRQLLHALGIQARAQALAEVRAWVEWGMGWGQGWAGAVG
jgi:NADH dehydrogenase [ubiquinone] 1 alpha subcomplex assembly factor 7